MCKRKKISIKIKPIQLFILTAISELVEIQKKINFYTISNHTGIDRKIVKSNLKQLKELELC